MTLYYSVRTRQALKQHLGQLPLGLPHYSYGIVCQKFLSLFADMGVQAIELPMPEIYPSYRNVQRGAADTSRPIHVMFKAFDELRLLKGAYNVVHVAWEYSRLPSFGRMPKFHPKRVHPLNDYVYALGLVDEIWVGCSFTRDTLVREGLSNVHVIPAPINLRQGGMLPSRNAAGLFQDAAMAAPLEIVECTRQSIIRETERSMLLMRVADCKFRGGRVFLSVFKRGAVHRPATPGGAITPVCASTPATIAPSGTPTSTTPKVRAISGAPSSVRSKSLAAAPSASRSHGRPDHSACRLVSAAAPEGPAEIAEAVEAELRALAPAYVASCSARERSTIGLSGLPPAACGEYLAAWLRGERPASPAADMSPALALRFAIDDLKAFALEAALPAGTKPSSKQLGDWLWNDTALGAALQVLRQKCLAGDDERLKAVAAFFVPALRVAAG